MTISETIRQWLADRPPVEAISAAVTAAVASPTTQKAVSHILGSIITAAVVGLGGYLFALPKLEAQLDAVRTDVAMVRQDVRDMKDGMEHRREVFDSRLRAVEVGQAEMSRGRR